MSLKMGRNNFMVLLIISVIPIIISCFLLDEMISTGGLYQLEFICHGGSIDYKKSIIKLDDERTYLINKKALISHNDINITKGIIRITKWEKRKWIIQAEINGNALYGAEYVDWCYSIRRRSALILIGIWLAYSALFFFINRWASY
jgi:hypothetical protein